MQSQDKRMALTSYVFLSDEITEPFRLSEIKHHLVLERRMDMGHSGVLRVTDSRDTQAEGPSTPTNELEVPRKKNKRKIE